MLDYKTYVKCFNCVKCWKLNVTFIERVCVNEEQIGFGGCWNEKRGAGIVYLALSHCTPTDLCARCQMLSYTKYIYIYIYIKTKRENALVKKRNEVRVERNTERVIKELVNFRVIFYTLLSAPFSVARVFEWVQSAQSARIKRGFYRYIYIYV